MASADLGEFGPTDGRPVLYHFSPLYRVQGFIAWLLLPLAFVVFKENRTAQAAWILVPIALLAAIYWVVRVILKLSSGDAVQMNVLFMVMVVGFSLVWLLGERIGNRNRFLAFLLATLVWFGFLGVSLLGAGVGKTMIMAASMAAVSIPPIVLAFVAATLVCAKTFGRFRFIACMAGTLFVSLLAVLSAVMLIFSMPAGRSMSDRLVEVLLASFVISLVYFVGLLPFLVLLFANSFWRKRLEYVTGIRTTVQ
ncbi:MAG: hypothetical protein ABFE13_07565 [Phycisphaerales bacterium]